MTAIDTRSAASGDVFIEESHRRARSSATKNFIGKTTAFFVEETRVSGESMTMPQLHLNRIGPTCIGLDRNDSAHRSTPRRHENAHASDPSAQHHRAQPA